jgi:SAP domain-containing protein
MTLYARSDMMSVSIPATSGGCGANHTRPVVEGAPVRDWGLDCPPCEGYLRGDRKQKILKTTPGDSKNGVPIPGRQERVADSDPFWSSTAESVPLTPDELKVNAGRTERATTQIQMIQALAALRAAGTEIPFETEWLMERELPSAFIKGQVICSNLHNNIAGAKFCNVCGVSMNKQNEITPPQPKEELITEIPLHMLAASALKQKCKELGLPVNGRKEEMIKRLEAARQRVSI